MAFSIFCILESIVLVMNAFAILNERFLKTGIFSDLWFFLVGLHAESINFVGSGA